MAAGYRSGGKEADAPALAHGSALRPVAAPSRFVALLRRHASSHGTALCLAALAALAAGRIAGNHFSVLDLHRDEAQYWVWSQELAWGYVSKPPLIAWIMRAAEFVCGDGTTCLHAPSSILWSCTGVLIYAIARELYDDATAILASLAFAVAPAVTLSSRLITTDVPLLFFWTLALLAYVKLLSRPHVGWSLLLGVAFGLGLLAKYAMIYFVPCAALAALLDRRAAALLRRPHLWLAAAVGVAIMLPNFLWNAEHGFDTLRHTGDNIASEATSVSVARLLEFLLAQLSIVGPVLFAAYAIGGFQRSRSDADKLMLVFSFPILALIGIWALLRVTHGNWAATAFPAATILAMHWLLSRKAYFWIAASFVLVMPWQIALPILDANADRLGVAGLAQHNPYRHVLGAHAFATAAGERAKRIQAPVIAAEDRNAVAALLYELRHEPFRIVAWQHGAAVDDYFEETRPLRAGSAGPVLFVSPCPNIERLARSYDTVRPLAAIDWPIGPTISNHYFVFQLDRPHETIAPAGAC